MWEGSRDRPGAQRLRGAYELAYVAEDPLQAWCWETEKHKLVVPPDGYGLGLQVLAGANFSHVVDLHSLRLNDFTSPFKCWNYTGTPDSGGLAFSAKEYARLLHREIITVVAH